MRAILAALGVFVLTAGSADAAVLCGEHDIVVANLKRNYSEVPINIGLGNNGTAIEILAAPSGSFTIIYTQANGLSCILAAGTAWEKAKKVEPGEPA